MPNKSHALNVYSTDNSKRFRVVPSNTSTVLDGDLNPIEINTSLTLPTHSDVGAALATAESTLATAVSDITTLQAGASAGAVQANLDAYETSNDTALATERGRIDTILAGADVNLDTLTEIVAAYEAADTTITTAVTGNTTNIATNTTDIATNVTNIATNASGIATNVTNIATNTSGIATNVTNIATNTSNISTNTTNISTNATDIATLTTNLATLTARVDELTAP